jgi:pyruvate kinase
MVALSFVRGPEDVERLHDVLYRLGANHLGIVLKIENRQAVENLPRILLASLNSPPVGIMIARGDLAVEVSFERLSEVQQEIL